MAIQPVDAAGLRDGRAVPRENFPAEGTDFGRVLDASLERGTSRGASAEQAATAAEILRLEMMRSAVSLSTTGPEPASANISNALKAFLTHYGEASQKTDTSESKISEATEADTISSGSGTCPAGDTFPFPGGQPTRFDGIIRNAANRYGVQEGLIKAVIKMESDFNPRAVSHAGARGLMQLMPSTAAGLGVRDAFDPEQNIMAGTRFLRDLLDKYGGNLDSALAAYNWGPGNVDKNRGAFLPRETREYLAKVKRYYAQFVG